MISDAWAATGQSHRRAHRIRDCAVEAVVDGRRRDQTLPAVQRRRSNARALQQAVDIGAWIRNLVPEVHFVRQSVRAWRLTGYATSSLLALARSIAVQLDEGTLVVGAGRYPNG